MDDFKSVDKIIAEYNAWCRDRGVNGLPIVRYPKSAEAIERSKNMGMKAYISNLGSKIEMELRTEQPRGLSTPYSSVYRWLLTGEPSLDEKMTPEKIIRSGPMTIIFWKDGTKTKVRRTEGAPDDPYLAFCAGLAKKVYGNNSKVKKLIEEKTVEPKERKKKEKKDAQSSESSEIGEILDNAVSKIADAFSDYE